METIHIKRFRRREGGLILAAGKFDACHLGHRRIIGTTVNEAGKGGCLPAVFTFRQFPVAFYLYRWEDRLSFLEGAGIELCLWADFADVSEWTAEEFIDRLLALGVEEFIVGFNFRFGSGREGDVEFLKRASHKKGFKIRSVPRVDIGGETVSTSKIRELVKQGRVDEAMKFLGSPFFVSGQVVRGRGIGTSIGYPTANLLLEETLPLAEGIYAGYARHNGLFYRAAVYVGGSPTFNETEKKIEVFMIDFQGDIYGKELKVYLMQKVRDDAFFENPEALSRQIRKDIETIIGLLRRDGPFGRV